MRTTILLLLFSVSVFAQEVKLHRNINNTSFDNSTPTLSGDGKEILFTSGYSAEKKIYYSKKSGPTTWKMQDILNNKIAGSKLISKEGIFWSYDGKELIMSSKQYGGVGKYDIWILNKKGNGWSEAINAGAPLNTTGNEAFPSLSTDGKRIYFSRCASLTEASASGCKIMYADRKSSGLFTTPKELPANVNSSNNICPLILADNETLIFSSDKAGGKGGYDFYLTRKEGDSWTDPIAYDFMNTSADEKKVSIPYKGNLAYYSKATEKKETLFRALIPKELRQKPIMILHARVNEATASMEIIDSKGKKKYISAEKGEFIAFLDRDQKYDVSIRDKAGKFSFESQIIDLSNLEKTKMKKMKVDLKSIQSGTSFELNNLSFERDAFKLSKEAETELDRLSFVMKKNPSLKFDIQVCQKQILKDTVKSNSDLTEVVYDTTYNIIDIPADTNQISEDSVFITPSAKDTNEVVKATYHNDRTEKQAVAVKKYLTSKGVLLSKVNIVGKGADRKELFEGNDKNRIVIVEIK